MDFILALYMIVVFTLGYLLMAKFDRIIESPYFLKSHVDTFHDNKAYILVFGYSKTAKKLIDILMNQKYDFIVIDTEDQLNKSISYSHLFAVSDSDFSNLMICLIAKKTLGIMSIIAICNRIENKSIFEQNKIPYLHTDQISAERLFNSFFQPKKQGDVL